MTNASRFNRFAGAAQKKKNTTICMFWINAYKLKPIKNPVTIHFDWYEPNAKRDPDNIRAGSKYILDALVEAGILPSDGQKWIHGLSDRFMVATLKTQRIEVTIEEAEKEA